MIDMSKWEAIAAQNVHNRASVAGRLGGKIAIVTGSAQGFGKGIAEILYAEGACVVIADLNEELAKTVAAEMGERAFAVKVNVADEESVVQMITATVEKFGGLDLLVSNAGVLKAGSLDELEKKDFEFVTAINYTAFFTCVKYTQRIMRAQYEADHNWMGDIISINSKSGLQGSNKNSAYAGGKFGGIGLVQSFALELCPYNIKVNAICPGNFYDGPLWSDPERGLFVQYLNAGKVPGAKTVEDVKEFYLSKSPIHRGCLPSDVAKAILYAVEQTFETGQAIAVTGGQAMLH
ncbi:MAG: SDR family NAD(P)-dependent oxidoreductase [Oscillospiraceae bacterium]|nr:SDR family NAD(P)-dependent oxidoreductase [Oscillospiraceae bacterium]